MKIQLLFIYFFPMFVNSYYKQGHELIGRATDSLLSVNTKNSIGMSIEEISPWADSVRKNPNYSWAAPLHYIDTGDRPDNDNCFIESYNEDKNNLFSSLTNYTKRLKNKKTRTQEDLKFFVHFYQDLFQPLHMSGVFRGGNNYDVDFFGRSANLHQVWDYLILRERIQEIKHYDDYLVHLARYNVPYDPFNYKFWISHNNKLNCRYVYKELGKNITTAYFDTNKLVIENLIIMSVTNLKYILESLY